MTEYNAPPCHSEEQRSCDVGVSALDMTTEIVVPNQILTSACGLLRMTGQEREILTSTASGLLRMT